MQLLYSEGARSAECDVCRPFRLPSPPDSPSPQRSAHGPSASPSDSGWPCTQPAIHHSTQPIVPHHNLPFSPLPAVGGNRPQHCPVACSPSHTPSHTTIAISTSLLPRVIIPAGTETLTRPKMRSHPNSPHLESGALGLSIGEKAERVEAPGSPVMTRAPRRRFPVWSFVVVAVACCYLLVVTLALQPNCSMLEAWPRKSTGVKAGVKAVMPTSKISSESDDPSSTRIKLERRQDDGTNSTSSSTTANTEPTSTSSPVSSTDETTQTPTTSGEFLTGASAIATT